MECGRLRTWKDGNQLKTCIIACDTCCICKRASGWQGNQFGGTYVTKEPRMIATIPVGYADGYARGLSNKGAVLIHGRRAPILGRVCMDQFMVDVTDIPDVKNEDEVILIGRDGDECITMEEVGGLSGRFNYEFACDLGKRIPRVYIHGGRIIGTRDHFSE